VSDAFKAVVNTTPTHTLLTLSGVLGEDAEMPDLSTKLPIRINLRGLTRINSRGVKKWYTWIHKFKEPVRIYLDECTPGMINTFNMVKGSHTEQMQIDSFLVPMYSAKTGERRDILLVRGKNFTDKSVNVPEQKDTMGNVMELDVHDSYFAFLTAK
jgi:hypothetical protein